MIADKLKKKKKKVWLMKRAKSRSEKFFSIWVRLDIQSKCYFPNVLDKQFPDLKVARYSYS